MADVIDTTQSIVLSRIVARLRAVFSSLPERLCYETLDPMTPPELPRGGGFALTVAPGDGVFDEDEQVGGGEEQLHEKSSVSVTIYVRTKLDRPGDAYYLLQETNRGLLHLKKRVLAALVGHELKDAAGKPLLTSHIYAMRSWRPQWRADEAGGIGMLAVAFGVDWHWEL